VAIDMGDAYLTVHKHLPASGLDLRKSFYLINFHIASTSRKQGASSSQEPKC